MRRQAASIPRIKRYFLTFWALQGSDFGHPDRSRPKMRRDLSGWSKSLPCRSQKVTNYLFMRRIDAAWRRFFAWNFSAPRKFCGNEKICLRAQKNLRRREFFSAPRISFLATRIFFGASIFFFFSSPRKKLSRRRDFFFFSALRKLFGAEKFVRRRNIFSGAKKILRRREKKKFSAEKFSRRRKNIFSAEKILWHRKMLIIRGRENFSAPRKLFGAEKILRRRVNFAAPRKTFRRRENYSAAKNSPARRQAASHWRMKR